MSIVFNPDEVADNMRKYGGFIPGIRPGKRTSEYLDHILGRITFGGAIYLALVAILPEFLITGFKVAPIPVIGPPLDMFLSNNNLGWITDGLHLNFYFGGTSLLIVVGVAMDTIAQVEAQLIMRHYDGFTGRVADASISATSMVTGANADAVWNKIIGFHNDAAGRQLTVLQDVYKSESDSNQRNQAIGALMFAYGYIKTSWPQAVDLYTRQCSIGVTAADLASMAATLAFGGRNPVTKKQVMDTAKVPGVLAVMATAGLYDDSGKWLYHTGLPAKSGVGGGIIAVAPGRFGIAVVSPPSTTRATASVHSAPFGTSWTR